MHLSSLSLCFNNIIDHLTSPPPPPIHPSSKLDNSLTTWPTYGQPCVKLICSYIIHFSFLCHMSSCQTHSYNNFHVFTPCSILVAVQRDRCTVRSVVMLSHVRNDTSDLQAPFLVCVYFMFVSLVCWTMSLILADSLYVNKLNYRCVCFLLVSIACYEGNCKSWSKTGCSWQPQRTVTGHLFLS